jgi:hypothetical protein
VESFLRVQLIEGKTGEGSGAQPPLPRKSVAQLKASATSIVNGGSVTLTWSTLNANSIFLSPNVGVVAESGSVTLSPTLTTTYRLVATNGAGPVEASVTVSVVNPTGSKTGLVAAYGFNEGKEAEAMDASGMGNTGMIFNAVRVDGHSGGGLAFNGFDTFVRVPHSGSLNLTSGMTLEAWVKPASNTHHSSVILKQHAVGGYTWLLYASDTAAATETSVQTQAGAFNTLDGAALAVGAWSHLAATYDGATYRLYINGSQVASVAASGTIQTSTLPLFIGGNIPFGDFFEGVVDDVRIYNRALSAAQIATDMSTPVP